jgi:hypothetical protein
MSENVAGESTRRMAKRRYLIRLLVIVVTLTLLLQIAQNGLHTRNIVGLITCLLAMLGLEKVVNAILDRLILREQHAVRGAKAEAAVGAILNRLPGNYRVFHDVPAQFGNLDHLVFRDDGAIFLIETKSHRGTVTIERNELLRDGQQFEKNFIKQTLGNVSWLKKSIGDQFSFTPAWVHSAIVFNNAHVPAHCKLFNVAVIRPSYLERWLEDQPGDLQARKNLWPQVARMDHIFNSSWRCDVSNTGSILPTRHQ